MKTDKKETLTFWLILSGAALVLAGAVWCLWVDKGGRLFHVLQWLSAFVVGGAIGLVLLGAVVRVETFFSKRRAEKSGETQWYKLFNDVIALYGEANYAEAALVGLKMLDDTEDAGIGSDQGVAGCFNMLGVLYRNYGQFGIAERFFTRALAIHEKDGTTNSYMLTTVLENLLTLYSELDQPAVCKVYAVRVLALYEKEIGADKSGLVPHLCSMGNVYMRLGQHKLAAPFYERALAIERTVYGQDHPRVAATMSTLGYIHGMCNEYEKAESLYQRVLAIQDRNLGPEHPALVATLNSMAEVLRHRCRHMEADEMQNRAAAIYARMHESDENNGAKVSQ